MCLGGYHECMGKKKKSKKPPRAKKVDREAAANRASAESRTAEVVTVAWMLTTLVTLLAVVVCLAIWLFMLAVIPEGERAMVAALPVLMLVIACITSLVAGALTVAAQYLRKQKPPRAITMMAVAIVASPYVLLIVLNLVALLR